MTDGRMSFVSSPDRQRREFMEACRIIEHELPDGWTVTKIAGAYSMAHECVMYTAWMQEDTMGWDEWCMGANLNELMAASKAVVDRLMLSTVPC